MSENSERNDCQPSSAAYATTRWSLVLSAAQQATSGLGDNSKGTEALNDLCRIYWLPLYAYARKRTSNGEEAKDLTQSFFHKLLEKNYLVDVKPEKGRFRNFLITAFKRFLSNEWNKNKTLKRGGQTKTVSLDFTYGDSQLSLEPANKLTPEQIFERQWAITMLRNCLDKLRNEYDKKGKLKHFEQLKEHLTGIPNLTGYNLAAQKLETTEAAVKMTVHRMRERYRQILRANISETVSEASEIDDEILLLFRLFEQA